VRYLDVPGTYPLFPVVRVKACGGLHGAIKVGHKETAPGQGVPGLQVWSKALTLSRVVNATFLNGTTAGRFPMPQDLDRAGAARGGLSRTGRSWRRATR